MSPIARSGDMDIWYESLGPVDDAPLLLIAGIGAQSVSWPDELCTLLQSQGFGVIRYDHREVGLSSRLPSDLPEPDVRAIQAGDFRTVAYSLDALAADAVAVLDALDVESAHIVGHSMGGMVAQLLAMQHPQRVRSLTSISATTGDPAVGRPSDAGMQRLLPSSSGSNPVADAADVSSDPVERALAGRRATASPGFPFDEPLQRQLIERAMERGANPVARMRHLAAAYSAPDRTPDLRNLSMPVLVVHGTDDPVVDVSGGRATAAVVPGADLLVVPGMAHELPREVWPELVERITGNARRSST